jgi:hypothetical protein
MRCPLKRVNSIIVLPSPIIPGSTILSIRSPTPQEGDAFLSTASTDGLPGFMWALQRFRDGASGKYVKRRSIRINRCLGSMDRQKTCLKDNGWNSPHGRAILGLYRRPSRAQPPLSFRYIMHLSFSGLDSGEVYRRITLSYESIWSIKSYGQ